MQKAIVISQAVQDFDRLEKSFQRAIQPEMVKETRVWWMNYYDRRSQEIATIHKTTVEDLINEWYKYRAELKERS